MKILNLNLNGVKGKRLLLIDGNNLVHRCYHGAKQVGEDKQKQVCTLLALNQILNFKNLCLNSILIPFWDSDHSYRAEEFSFYKQHKLDDGTNKKFEIIEHVKNIFSELGFQNLEQYGYEGDDLISLYSSVYSSSNKCIIFSTDNDLFQCLKPRVLHYNPIKNEVQTHTSIKEKMGLTPSEIPINKALIGKKNEVPGVPKIGEKTALKIIKNEVPFPGFDMNLFYQYLRVSTLPFQKEGSPISLIELKKFNGSKSVFKKVFKENNFENFLTTRSMKIWSKAFRLKE